jgi:hypothetical protein
MSKHQAVTPRAKRVVPSTQYEALDAKYAELQLQLSEALDSLAWAEAELRNLRAWRDVASRLTHH